MIRLLSRLSRHGILFVLAKSTVLVAPLLAAKQLSQADYGQVEWWLALSMALGPMAALGAHGLLAYASVGSKARLHERTAGVYVVQAGVALIAMGVFCLILGVDPARHFAVPVLILSGVICLQMSLAARLKGIGFGAWASLIESGVYVCLLGALLLASAGFGFVRSYLGLLLLAGALNVIGLIRFVRLPRLDRWWRRNYRGFVVLGSRFMVGGVLVGIFMAAPRGILGLVDGDVAVARFALVFRWLSISIVAHQFIMTLFFRNLFSSESNSERDRLLAATVGLVSLLSIALVLVIREGWLGQFGLPQPSELDHRLLWLMAAVMVLWSTSACLEGSLYRADGTRAQISAAAMGLCGLGASSTVLMLWNMEAVIVMVLAWLAGFVVTVIAQFRALVRRNQGLPKLTAVAVLALTLCLSAALLT